METIGTIRVSKSDSLDFDQKLAKGIGEIRGDEGVWRGVFVVFQGGDPQVAHVVIRARFVIQDRYGSIDFKIPRVCHLFQLGPNY